jgi:hypothetical protein
MSTSFDNKTNVFPFGLLSFLPHWRIVLIALWQCGKICAGIGVRRGRAEGVVGQYVWIYQNADEESSKTSSAFFIYHMSPSADP